MQQVNVLLDDNNFEELSLMAQRLGADPMLLARVLLSNAIEAERLREDSRQNQPPEHWEEFQTQMTEALPLQRYADTL